jgi:ribonuclease P protein component
MGVFSFTKEERLHKRKDIQELFEKGSSFYVYPFKVFWSPQKVVENTQILVSVSNRNFKRAVDRNLLKRRMREAYRLNKSKLSGKPLQVAFVFTAKQIMPFKEIESKILLVFGKLEKSVRQQNDDAQ